jgi:hypothetical protein
MATNNAPVLRNAYSDALYKNEASAARSLFHLAADGTFSFVSAGTFPNPLLNANPGTKLTAKNADTGCYWVFVPPDLINACVAASGKQGPKPVLKITIFFDPFPAGSTMFYGGLRSIFSGRATDMRVLIVVPGNEGAPVQWGIGITNTQIRTLLQQCNAGYSEFQVTILAAWSAGYRGMLSVMRATGMVNDLVELKYLEQVILYFLTEDKTLVDTALSKVQTRISTQSTNGMLQVIAYLVTPRGNSSLKPAEILDNIPFLKKNNLGQGLIVFTDAMRGTLRKLCIIRAIAWALEEGAITKFQISAVMRAACTVIDKTPRNTVRSLPSLPYGKGSSTGATSLAAFASDRNNAAITNIGFGPPDFTTAVDLVNAGCMIYGLPFDGFTQEIDHMVLVPELAWEFLAG